MAAEAVDLPALPMRLEWLREPESWSSEGGALTIAAGARTDWFVDPGGAETVLNAPALVGIPPDRDFTLAARVRVDAAATFDAGVLLVHRDDRTWAKLCLERSPEGKPTIVSVVTRGVSDDCNSWTCERGEAWLRVARLGDAFALHASADGGRWELVRYFGLPPGEVRLGFEVQSPTGAGCTATFAALAYEAGRLASLRDGS